MHIDEVMCVLYGFDELAGGLVWIGQFTKAIPSSLPTAFLPYDTLGKEICFAIHGSQRLSNAFGNSFSCGTKLDSSQFRLCFVFMAI